ncbi:hypothetical protein DPEC_G00188410 [Dallia pectoralis]|uniref:Uncharacterized protein n=1 Tax=Dallia pectoralis TaxID=75939 RepID=A0ACC2GC68_DALPE|nr:hypothetical protein DPEC_G00188410 [Dallia pectoralis]
MPIPSASPGPPHPSVNTLMCHSCPNRPRPSALLPRNSAAAKSSFGRGHPLLPTWHPTVSRHLGELRRTNELAEASVVFKNKSWGYFIYVRPLGGSTAPD